MPILVKTEGCTGIDNSTTRGQPLQTFCNNRAGKLCKITVYFRIVVD